MHKKPRPRYKIARCKVKCTPKTGQSNKLLLAVREGVGARDLPTSRKHRGRNMEEYEGDEGINKDQEIEH
jgi:hypothetical protein